MFAARAGNRRADPRGRALRSCHRRQQPAALLKATNLLAEVEPLMQQDKRIPVPFGDNLTPEQRVSRMLEIIEDLHPLACISQEDFYKEDNREEAGAYAAALGRCASKLPPDFVARHPEIDWTVLEDFRYTSFHDGIDVLILRDRLQKTLPILKVQLQNILAAVVP
jgi:uncharacterized protein with HEPN domain